jgi:hypothetical protein
MPGIPYPSRVVIMRRLKRDDISVKAPARLPGPLAEGIRGPKGLPGPPWLHEPGQTQLTRLIKNEELRWKRDS